MTLPVTKMSGLESFQIGTHAVITTAPRVGYIAVSCPLYTELNGCHYWNAFGELSFYEFLLSLDQGYVLDKLFAPGPLQEFDAAATRKEALAFFEDSGSPPPLELVRQLEEATTEIDFASISAVNDPPLFFHYRRKACADWFWNTIWASFMEFLRADYNPAPPEFLREFLGEPYPAPKRRRLAELALEYHHRTEEFDRTVCTGPIHRGEIMPVTASERRRCYDNAMRVKEDLYIEFVRPLGFSRAEWLSAIQDAGLRCRPYKNDF